MTNRVSPAEDFFKAGGALDSNAPSYVRRQADDDLMQAVLAGQYCNVLTARQMGKSSLMARTVRRLQEEGVRTVTIDLTGLGTEIDASKWYFGLVSRFKRQLRLSVDEEGWWRDQDLLGPVHRFSDFLRQVVLEKVQEPIVVFVDEIDSTLKLPFTDDFFAAIRAAYNARAKDSTYKRLTFVLLGVARPSDLIKDRTRTPYNIGASIDVTDFTMEEAQVLLVGLEGACQNRAEEILKRVLYWTGGHPYLTQKVCGELVIRGSHWTEERVDDLVRDLFLAEEARKETNLQFIRNQIRESDERAGMLRVYRRVRAGKRVEDEEQSVVKSRLKLTGLVKTTTDGFLAVRNFIYERVFDRDWVRENVPVSPMRRVAIGMAAMLALALIVVGGLVYRQRTLADEVRAGLYRDDFLSAISPEVQINNLAGLLGLRGYENEARDLFFGLDAGQRLAMFEGLESPEQVGRDVLTVVVGVYQDSRLANNAEDNQLLQTMADVLHQVEGVRGAKATAIEIDYWMTGRERVTAGDYAAAVVQYTLALGLHENLSVLFDRGQAYTALGEYENALIDLQEVAELDSGRESAVLRVIEQDSGLFTYVEQHRHENQTIAAWFPMLTPPPTTTNTPASFPTSTPTDTPTPTSTPTNTPTPTDTPTPAPTSLPRSVPDTGTIVGTLMWNGEPLLNTELLLGYYLQPGVFETVVTDESGQFVIDNIPAGPKYAFKLVLEPYDDSPFFTQSQGISRGFTIEPDTVVTGTVETQKLDLEIISPLDGAVTGGTPAVVWEAYPGAVSYHVIVYPESGSRPVVEGNTTDTSWTVPEVLTPGNYMISVYASGAQLAFPIAFSPGRVRFTVP